MRGLREDVGLGSPPAPFFTNASESINAVLKETMLYKKQQQAVFNNKVRKAVENHQHEIEKAIINRWQYQIRQQYNFLICSEDTWFRMTSDQRLVYIKILIPAVFVHRIVIMELLLVTILVAALQLPLMKPQKHKKNLLEEISVTVIIRISFLYLTKL